MNSVYEELRKKSARGIVQFFRYGLISALALLVDVVASSTYLKRALAHGYIIASTVSFLARMLVVYLRSICGCSIVGHLKKI